MPAHLPTSAQARPLSAVRTGLLLIGAVLGLSLLPGCVVVPAHRGYAPQAYDGGEVPIEVAPMPPPPPYAEVVPIVPFAGALWITGYWGWSGGRHAWVGGHYERARPGYGWVPHRWVQGGGGQWHLHGGGWVRR